METKRCSKCGEVKPVENFCIRRRRGRVERNSRCKTCASESCTAWRLKNRDKSIDRAKRWRECNQEKVVFYRKKRAIERPEIVRAESNKSHHKAAITCSDFYMKIRLLKCGFKKEHITPDLIKAQRAVLKIKRAVKEIQK